MLASWQIYLPQGGSPRRDGTQQASTFSICVGGALQFRFRVWWLLILRCVCSQSRYTLAAGERMTSCVGISYSSHQRAKEKGMLIGDLC